MRRRLAALLLALLAVLGPSAVPAAADDGPVDKGIEVACRIGTGPVLGTIMRGATKATGSEVCAAIGEVGEEKIKQEWKGVWESVLGDVINTSADVVKWTIKKVLTVALLGPSLDLKATGLFGRDATLAGMMTWLGLVVATAGAMWQIGKMALTGQSKHVGRAMLGWVENTVLSVAGVAMIALLLAAGDALAAGLVEATFKDDGKAYERIVAVMVPTAVSNPITMLGIVAVLLLVGFIQLILVFLRQSAIPIQCLLLPVAGGGRVGGDATRQWAPRLITSICVVIAYKPILALIICTGFAEFGRAQTLAEWLRGCATLILGILAPGPLTKIFAPFGEAVGAGMTSGGISGAFAGAAGYFTGKHRSDSGGDGARPMTPMEYARYVEQSMGSQGGRDGAAGESGGEAGRDAQTQAARNESGRVPRQPAPGEGPAAGTGTAAAGGQSAGAGTPAAAAGAGSAGAGGAGMAIQVLDGVNNTVQGASGQIGSGGQSQ
ncbi:hypothetical protein [Streptomyces carminius]|uniref:hypothetical protein n=1 Tax=Streptomyces carminius TaxID=2665496 RepID=UPI0011B3F229|nr:hypothetical protein [Streptomyces carminius]